MAKLRIDGELVEVDDALTLIQACEEAGVEIPRFCYHERLSIAGNCRMCLVEVVGMPKPIASCAMGVKDLRPGQDGEPPHIRTNTPLVKKAREGVMEFLLINHPLDCPICDQGGECDLQDQAMVFGFDASRYAENKRAVEDKDIGPLIKTIMTRCIHCTRCIRFATEVAGVQELGAIGRGEDMEITTYLEESMTSELSGNVIDLCPVGALTSKPYAFSARPWELRKTETIDVMDAIGSNIRVDARGREVMRVLPRNNDLVNEEWISDKTRFIWDGLRTQRLDQPYVRKSGRLQPASWDEAFDAIAERVAKTDAKRMGAIIGDLVAVEESFALLDLMGRLGSPNADCRQDGTKLNPAFGRASYLFNSGLAGVEEADAIILIGTNPRHEAAVLNARIRKAWRRRDVPIGLIGWEADLTYTYDYLGAGPETLRDLADGSHGFAKVLKQADRPMLILGQGALARADGEAVLRMAAKLALSTGMLQQGDAPWNGFNVLHTAAARVGALDLDAVPRGKRGLGTNDMIAAAGKGKLGMLYLLGADEIDLSGAKDCFIVYQGSHGDRGAQHADVVLPGCAYTEKPGTYVNTEGRVQLAARAAFPPGDAREDWTILRALSERLDHKLAYDSLPQLRAAMYKRMPHLAQVDDIAPGDMADIERLAEAADAEVGGAAPFAPAIQDFYLTNPIARSSAVMADLSARKLGLDSEATGTDG